MWLGLNIIILNITINLITLLSLQIGTLGLTITFLILTLIFVGMLLLERYILKVYAQRDFILKEHLPYASSLFLSIMFGLSVAFIVEFVAVVSGESFSVTRFLAVYIIVAMVYMIVFIRKSFRKKKQSN